MDDVGNYRCRDCGEVFPLLLEGLPDTVVGGLTTNWFARHGPGCKGQLWDHVRGAEYVGDA